ncbi:MAG: hypothetical protein FWF81_15440 [Defluviitaleaceae bacterium]|nr:hypothetical protein [Defluviitaleaceae bacterium]
MKRIGKIISLIFLLGMVGAINMKTIYASEEITFTVTPTATTAAHGNSRIAAVGDEITFEVHMGSASGTDLQAIHFRMAIPAGFELVENSATVPMTMETLQMGLAFDSGVEFTGLATSAPYNGVGGHVATFRLRALSSIGNNASVGLNFILLEDAYTRTIIPNVIPVVINDPAFDAEVITFAVTPSSATAAVGDEITFEVHMGSAAGTNLQAIHFRMAIPTGFELVANSAEVPATMETMRMGLAFDEGVEFTGLATAAPYNGAGGHIATFRLRAISAVGNNTAVGLNFVLLEDAYTRMIIPSISPAIINMTTDEPPTEFSNEITFTVTPSATTAAVGDEITFNVHMGSASGTDLQAVHFRMAIPAGFELVENSAAVPANMETAQMGLAFNEGVEFNGLAITAPYNGAGGHIAAFRLRAISTFRGNVVVSINFELLEDAYTRTIIPNVVPAIINAPAHVADEITFTVTPSATIAAVGDEITFNVHMGSAAGTDLQAIHFKMAIPAGFELVENSAEVPTNMESLQLGLAFDAGVEFTGLAIAAPYNGEGGHIATFRLRMVSVAGNNAAVGLNFILLEDAYTRTIIPNIIPAVINFSADELERELQRLIDYAEALILATDISENGFGISGYWATPAAHTDLRNAITEAENVLG